MAWVYLLTAGLLEITCTTIFRFTDGMTKLVPTVSFFVIGFVSFYFLNRSLTGIPLGTRLRRLDRHRRGGHGAHRNSLLSRIRRCASFSSRLSSARSSG